MANKDMIINDPDTNPEQKAIKLLLGIAQSYQSEMIRALANLDISPLQAEILAALASAPKGGMTVNQLKRQMVDDNPNVSRALNKLMRSELIKKKRSEIDQRVVHIKITDKGKAMHEIAETALVPVLKLPLSEKQTLALYELLADL